MTTETDPANKPAAVTTKGPKPATADHELDLSMLPAKRDYRRIAAFCSEFVKVPKGTGAGGPFKLRKWQLELVKAMYPPTGARPRQGLVSLPRGNGKSTLAAALALYGLFADGILGASVIVVASDERQARIVFNTARRMIEMEPRLAEQAKMFQDKIVIPATDSTMSPLPAEPAALQGWDPSLTIVDELHVVTEAVWDSMALAAGKRDQSLTLAISTPADKLDSVMWRLVEYGRNNPDDRTFRLVEYAAPDDCALDDPVAWAAANPALGDFLHADALAATLKTTREEPFRRYRLGQWVGHADAWLPWGVWAERRHPDAQELPDDGTPIVLAFDGSASGDSTALVGCTLGETPHLFAVAIWESPADDPRWRVPRSDVAGMVAAAFDRWDVRELAADPWGWRTELEQWAAEFGDRVVEWNTAHAGRMAPATDRAYAAISEGRITHDGNETLAAHMGNAVAKRTPMGDLVSKDKRGSTRKIDACVAAIVAHDRAAWHRANPPKRRRVVAHV
jgi:phage terminase large subunit-like protein